MTTKTLFTAQAADGNSAAIRVKAHPGNSTLETVMIRGYGTWSGATVTLKVSDNATASPSTFTGWTDSSGTAIGAFTDDFAVNLLIPSGLWFRAEVSGSGSPVPSLTVRATGELE